MSWRNRQFPGILSLPIGSVAANAEQERSILELENNDIEIISARFVPDTAIVTSTAAGFTFQLVNKGTSGTAAGTVASYTGNTVAGTLALKQGVAMTLAAGMETISAGEVLTWKETTLGTGTARYNVNVIIEYVIL